MISTVYYLHEDWQDGWGGELHLQDKNDIWHVLQPKPNRIALFQSDLLHEVFKKPSVNVYRLLQWLRSDSTIL